MTFNWSPFFILITLACSKAPTHSIQSTLASETLLNSRDIAGQTQEDIATILGHQSMLDPESAARSGCPTCQKYSYKDGLVKIVYINDMADWITITPTGKYQARDTPTLLGLPDAKPDYQGPEELRWTGYKGIQQISAFRNSDGTLAYIYMKVTTP